MSVQQNYRIEHDSMGEIRVPSDALWGAQTQRSLEHFAIGTDKFSPHFIKAFALVKKAAAQCNLSLGAMDASSAELTRYCRVNMPISSLCVSGRPAAAHRPI